MNFESLPVEEFLEESQELLQEIESSLLLLERQPNDRDVIQRLFRAAHTLKGGAGMVGLTELESQAHQFEALLSNIRSGTLACSPEIITTLLNGRDALLALIKPLLGISDDQEYLRSSGHPDETQDLDSLIDEQQSASSPLPREETLQEVENVYLLHLRFGPNSLQQGQEPLSLIKQLDTLGHLTSIPHTSEFPRWLEFDPTQLYLWWSVKLVSPKPIEEIDQLVEFYRGGQNQLQLERVETPREEDADVRQAHEHMLKQISESTPPKQFEEADSPVQAERVTNAVIEQPQASQSIRVPVSRLDRLQNLVSETVIRQARLLRLNEAIQAADEILGEQFLQFVDDNEQAVRELQDQIQQVRMVPVSTIFSPMKRVVRDFASNNQKEISLEIYGAETELDKTITEQIQGPLLHLLRNAMDHGLETPEQRKILGKEPSGKITLRASQQQGFVVIEVSDNGRGLDPEKILEAGRRLGIVPVDQKPSEQEILQLIFQPGFTTKTEVSETSGRGVGMDAVKRSIEALLGNIEISSKLGIGTTIRLRLPLSLAIIEGMMIRIGAEVFVIPLLLVVETLRPLPKQRKRFKHQGELIDIRGEYYPLVRLHKLLRLNNCVVEPEEGLLIVVKQGSQSYCLLVDEIIDQLPVVIKSLDEHFIHIPGIAGATILGDGSVCFILDIASLLT